MSYIEEFDKLKTKVLKYILFKKRTEQEVRNKFINLQGEILNEVIEELKDLNYINDKEYVNKAVKEFINLINMSIKEIEYKLISKGINKELIDSYIYKNKEKLLDYEIQSAKNIINKKIQTMQTEEILNYLRKKRYMEESIKIASKMIEE